MPYVSPPIDLAKAVRAYGSFTGLAERLDLALSTVHGWGRRGNVPPWRRREIAAAAALDGKDVLRTPRVRKPRSG